MALSITCFNFSLYDYLFIYFNLFTFQFISTLKMYFYLNYLPGCVTNLNV